MLAEALRAASVPPFHAMAMARLAAEREAAGRRVLHLEETEILPALWAGKVVVAEQSPSVVEWNRVHVGGLAGRPLEDPRVSVRVGDVRQRIAEARGGYDLILLDVDNGPDALIHRANGALYDDAGIAAEITLISLIDYTPWGNALFGTAPPARRIPYQISGRKRTRLHGPARAFVEQVAEAFRKEAGRGSAELLLELRGSHTIMVIEHDMEFVMGLTDRLVVMDFGEKLAEGAPAEIQRNPRVLEAYLGGVE